MIIQIGSEHAFEQEVFQGALPKIFSHLFPGTLARHWWK